MDLEEEEDFEDEEGLDLAEEGEEEGDGWGLGPPNEDAAREFVTGDVAWGATALEATRRVLMLPEMEGECITASSCGPGLDQGGTLL